MYKQVGSLLLLGAFLSSAAWGQTEPRRDFHRNPFVPPSTAIYTHKPVVAPPIANHPPTSVSSNVRPPSFQVAGIYSSAGRSGALVLGTRPHTVRVGDSIGGYQVTAIDAVARTMTLTADHRNFQLRMPKQP